MKNRQSKRKPVSYTHLAKLERQSPFPDEIFYRIFEIEDNVERQKYIEALRNEAKILKRSTEFNNLLKQFQLDYIPVSYTHLINRQQPRKKRVGNEGYNPGQKMNRLTLRNHRR